MGSRAPSSSALATSGSPYRPMSTGRDPRLTTQVSDGRRRPGAAEREHARLARPARSARRRRARGASRRIASAARYSSSVEAGSPAAPRRVSAGQVAGAGSQAAQPSGPKPYGGSSPAHGSGTRQPSRLSPVRRNAGSCAQLVGQVEHLGQAQLLALVEVGRAGQGQHQQGGRPGPAQADVAVAVAGDVPLLVVVGQHPGGRRADQRRPRPATLSMTLRNDVGRPGRPSRKSKLNAWCSSSGPT